MARVGHPKQGTRARMANIRSWMCRMIHAALCLDMVTSQSGIRLPGSLETFMPSPDRPILVPYSREVSVNGIYNGNI